MLEVAHRRKLFFVRLKDIHYACEINNEEPGIDAVYYFNCQESHKNAKECNTLLIDLAPDPETILSSFRKSTRSKIRKVLKDPSVTLQMSENPEPEEVENFFREFNRFADEKNIDACHEKLLKDFHSKGRLMINTASQGDEILAQFALFNLEDRIVKETAYNTRFIHMEDPDKVQLISCANRALDYTGMLYAKELGKKYYDLCGLTLDCQNTETQNVDHYKLGFRGEIVKEYHFIKPFTYRGKIFCWLKKLKSIV